MAVVLRLQEVSELVQSDTAEEVTREIHFPQTRVDRQTLYELLSCFVIKSVQLQ